METNTITRYVGICQICFGGSHKVDNKLSVDKRIVSHGYRRPGDGANHGNCRGVGHEPLEVSCDETRAYRADLLRESTALIARIVEAKAGHVATLVIQTVGTRTEKSQLVTIGHSDPRWARSIEIYIRDLERDLRWTQRELERIGPVIAAWKPVALRTVEEAEGKTKSERDAKSAEIVAARKKRIDDWIVAARLRVKTAIRRKTGSTIADIFEGVGRKIPELSNYEIKKENARPMLELDHVFQAFGLDVTQDYNSAHNAEIISGMRGWREETFVWPASLV